MIATLSALGALLGFSGSFLEINVNAKNGDMIAGEYVFRVTVVSQKPVTQVECYVGDELRESDSSTPYEFKLDTLAEKEGELKLTFAAYTSENESLRKSVSVKIDNGLTKGADFHVQRANDMLAISKWDDAIHAARVALKAKPGHNPARLSMARAYLGKGVMDSAQKFAEDAVAADPNYTEASELLTAINLQRAFNTFHRGTTGDQKETLETIRGALKSAVEIRKKNLDTVLDKMGAPGSGNILQYADLAIKAHRYSAAINALSNSYRTDARNPVIVNRLAYAQIRMGRFQDAVATFAESKRHATIDAYGYALIGLIEAYFAHESESDSSMSEAFLNDAENLGVRTAQAYIAMARGKLDVLSKVARDLARDESAKTEVQYYLANFYNSLGQYADARNAFERCVLAEPLNYDMFVSRGIEALSLVVGGRLIKEQNAYQLDVARMFFETALVAKPESAEAFTGLALCSVNQDQNADCLRFARAAVGAAPSYAPGHYTLSMAESRVEQQYRAQAEAIRKSSRDGNLTPEQNEDIRKLLSEADKLGADAQKEIDIAGKLDDARLRGRNIPRPLDCYGYYMRYGRMPLIAAPK